MTKLLAQALALALALLIAPAIVAPTASGAADWRLEQPAAPEPPDGVVPLTYPVALGGIGDVQFWAPNRGLMVVKGNGRPEVPSGQDGIVKEGLYRFDGTAWTPFSNVCGGEPANARIVWAGPREFWAIAKTRVEDRVNLGLSDHDTLCHFRDGKIVASYATPPSDPDRYRAMDAGACVSPDDCWFAGVAQYEPEAATPNRAPGIYYLHWDGTNVKRVFGPQGRNVMDLEAFDGRTYAALTNSTDTIATNANGSERPAGAHNTLFEPRPLLLHAITGGTTTITADPFVSAFALAGRVCSPLRTDAANRDEENCPGLSAADEFSALDADQDHLWAAGNPARTGPGGRLAESRKRLPFLVVRDAGAGAFRELPTVFERGFTIADIAANPGTGTAWIALEDPARPDTPLVVQVDSSGTLVGEIVALPLGEDTSPYAGNATTGGASKITCSAANECWLATARGWLYHLSDGVSLEQDDDPYFQTYFPTRPADATSVIDVSDLIPPDDSGADLPFVDQTLPAVEQVEDADLPEVTPPPRATNVRVRAISRKTVQVSFRLSARANVELRLLRGKKTVVAKYKRRVLARGQHKLRFRVTIKRWPNNIKLDVTNA